MKQFKKLLGAVLLLIAVMSQAQEAEATSKMIFVEYSLEEASETFLTIIKPSGLNEISRGFKPIKGTEVEFTGTIQELDGIQKFFINDKEIGVNSNGAFSSILTLPKGEQKVTMLVIDGKNNQTTKVFEILVEESLNEPTLYNGVGKYYALLIGVNNYDDPKMVDLDFPVDDAKSLQSVLKNNYNFEQENIILLEDASRRDIVETLDDLAAKITPMDNLLIFYAGHGFWDEKSSVGYWIPSNGSKESSAEWFGNSTLTDQLRTIKSQHTLLIADACFSGGIFKGRSAFSDASLAVNSLYQLKSRKAMTSGALTEVPDRSVFMKYLVRRLETNTEKYLSSEQLFSSIRMGVINNADVVPQYGTIQKTGDEGGDFIFIKSK